MSHEGELGGEHFLETDVEVDLPLGANKLDEEAIRQARAGMLEQIKQQRPDLSPEALLHVVDQALVMAHEQASAFLDAQGGSFQEEGYDIGIRKVEGGSR